MSQPLALVATSPYSSVLVETDPRDPRDIDKLATSDSSSMTSATALAPLGRSLPTDPFGENHRATLMLMLMFLHQDPSPRFLRPPLDTYP